MTNYYISKNRRNNMAIPETYDLVLPLLEIIKDKDIWQFQKPTI